MKSILSYITERLVLSKNKPQDGVSLEDFILWAGDYDSINDWTYDEYEECPFIMSEECLTRKCHDNLSELYEYLNENLDVLIDITNPTYDGKMYFYTTKIGKYIFEISVMQEYTSK